MLTADLNHRYFGELAVWYQGWDRRTKIFLAVTSSTSVSGWAIWGQPGWDWLWQSLASIAAVVAVVLPILNPSSSVGAASRLRGGWFSILKDYELLWAQLQSLDNAIALERCREIAVEEKRLDELDSTIKRRSKLVLLCHREVCKSRGLPVD